MTVTRRCSSAVASPVKNNCATMSKIVAHMNDATHGVRVLAVIMGPPVVLANASDALSLLRDAQYLHMMVSPGRDQSRTTHRSIQGRSHRYVRVPGICL